MARSFGTRTELPIEYGIPIPDRGSARKWKFPFKRMKVGGSILVPLDMYRDKERAWNSVTSCVRNAAKRYGFLFTMRMVDDDLGIRVWRLK